MKIRKLYRGLCKKRGKPAEQWRLWCKRPKTEREREEVVIGAVLTQRTNWRNVEASIENLKRAKIRSLKDINGLGDKRLAFLIKPSGFYKNKSQCLFNLAELIFKEYGSLAKMKNSDIQKLRNRLLKLKGIGPETADSILLYALDKPVFVIDEYTRRLVKKLKLADNFSYNFLQNLFEKSIEKDFKLYQDFHALIVIDGKS